MAANAKKRIEQIVPPLVQEVVDKVEKVSFNWAKLIARIYETNPLLCECGKEIKIISFVTYAAEIKRILSGIGWPTEPLEFDPPYDIVQWDICQLIPGTEDGFPEIEQYIDYEYGPDPPDENCDPPDWHDQDYGDPPHWSD